MKIMNLSLKESEAKKLIELTYLGFYVLANASTGKNLTEYELISKKVIKHYVKNTKKMRRRLEGLKKEIATKELYEEVGECMDEIHESAYQTVEELEKSSLPFVLSQALADLEYPDTADGDNLVKNILIQEFYEDEINKSGAGIVRIDIPDGEERLKKLLTAEQEEKNCAV
jgi:hypothetical protein